MSIKGFGNNKNIQVECRFCGKDMGIADTLLSRGESDFDVRMDCCDECEKRDEVYDICHNCGLPRKPTYRHKVGEEPPKQVYLTTPECEMCFEGIPLISYKGESISEHDIKKNKEMMSIKRFINSLGNLRGCSSVTYDMRKEIISESLKIIQHNEMELTSRNNRKPNIEIDFYNCSEEIQEYLREIKYTKVLGIED